ncbi:MAG: hypothetical protein JWL90_707 [Chthoniobacteraceae bacterium]|nr:hypothetical protein [Chthoniobacteraceae bacterium]
MKIGLVRRGYSPTGGAEAYLRRFAAEAGRAGHDCVLFATADWPAEAWHGHSIIRVSGNSPRAFARELEALDPRKHCDFLFSLERVSRCDAYRAGDGVHAAWLERRALHESAWRRFTRRFNRKHASLISLETALFKNGGAGMVIANSTMVKTEIEGRYGYPPGRIHVVHNGIPSLTAPPRARSELRGELGLDESDYVLLFAGSGWERKGLRFAIEAVNALAEAAVLLVAGRGNQGSMPASKRTRFLGPRADMASLLAAADVFILPTLYEPFSNACLEALAAGLPVITTRWNGFAEIIEAGVEGEILENPREIEAAAGAISRWASKEKREAIRPRLVEKGARFSIEENVRQTLSHIL